MESQAILESKLILIADFQQGTIPVTKVILPHQVYALPTAPQICLTKWFCHCNVLEPNSWEKDLDFEVYEF